MRRSCGIAMCGLSLLLAACYTTAPAPEPETEQKTNKDLVDFTFGWETPLTLKAETTRRVRDMGGEAREYRAEYEMEATRSDEMLRVAVDPQFQGVTGRRANGGAGQILGTVAILAVPTMVVSPEGGFETVEELDATRDLVAKEARRAAGGGLSKKVESALGRFLGDEVLEQRARQNWDMMVGMWAGETMEIGETYESKSEQEFTLPLVGRREVTMEVEFGALERVSCPAGTESGETGCVRATIRSRPDVRDMKELMQKWVEEHAEIEAKRQGMATTPKITVTEMFFRTEATLVTEISTLRPHRLTQKRTQRVKLRDPNGGERAFRTVDQRTTTFSRVE